MCMKPEVGAMTSSAGGASGTETRPTGRVRWRAAVTAVATVAPALVWVVAVPVLGQDLLVPGRGDRDPMEITLPFVVTTALVASLAGWALLAVLERVSRRAVTVWRVVAALTLLVSFAAPLLTEGMDTGTRVTLAVMHAVVAAVLIPALPREQP